MTAAVSGGFVRPGFRDARGSCSPTSQVKVEHWLANTALSSTQTVATSHKRKRSSCASSPSRIGTERPIQAATTMQALTPSKTGSTPNPRTPSSSKTYSYKTPSDSGWVAGRMTQHGMLYTHKSTLKKFPAFEAALQKVLYTDRNSAMKPKSARKFIDRHAYAQNLNEDTVLANLIPLLIKDEYTEKVNVTTQEKNRPSSRGPPPQDRDRAENKGDRQTQQQSTTQREWFSDGIFYTVDNQFRRTLLPHRSQHDHGFETTLAKHLAKNEGMTNPKPDYCWGFREDHMDDDRPPDVLLDSDIGYLLQISPGIESSFFLIEGKSNRGIPAEAQNQARRGGATLVNAGRRLRGYTVQDVEAEGVDMQTYVFSATMTPQCVEINVHWALVCTTQQPTCTEAVEGISPTNVNSEPSDSATSSNISPPNIVDDQTTTTHVDFHMTCLKTFALAEEDQIPALRAVLHNILEWGCTERLEQAKGQRKQLYDYQRQKNASINDVGRAKAGITHKKRKLGDNGHSSSPHTS